MYEKSFKGECFFYMFFVEDKKLLLQKQIFIKNEKV